jgi:hypothetical protein
LLKLLNLENKNLWNLCFAGKIFTTSPRNPVVIVWFLLFHHQKWLDWLDPGILGYPGILFAQDASESQKCVLNEKNVMRTPLDGHRLTML